MTDEADLSSNTLNSANSIAIEMRFNSTMTMNVTDSLGIGNEGGDKKNPMQMPIDDETSTNNSNSPSQPVPRAPVYFPTTSLEAELKVSFADLYESMQSVEHEYVSFASYTPTASYLPFRRYLVDWMSDVGDQFNLGGSTIHASILYLDKILRSREIPRSEWQLLATACISLASKYEEAEEHNPPIPDLLVVTKLSQSHDSLSFRDGECTVLGYLNWKLRAITPLHVVGYFLSVGVTFTNDSWQERGLIEKIPKYVKKYAEFFCNLCLQDYSFQQYAPTQLAAAIILSSRVALQLKPKWRVELTELTGHSEASIQPLFNHVYKYYEEQFPGHGGVRSNSPKSVADAF